MKNVVEDAELQAQPCYITPNKMRFLHGLSEYPSVGGCDGMPYARVFFREPCLSQHDDWIEQIISSIRA